ncbi:MAG: stage II sporulation protein M [Candidatus Fimenecus sp.]
MKRRKTHATIITTGIRKKHSVNSSILKKNQKLILLTTVFICGVLLGILFVKYAGNSTFVTLQNLIEVHFKQSEAQSVWLNFLSTFGTDCIYISVAFLLGLCLAGEPFIWLLPIVKGLGIGTVSACLYKAYTLQGLQYYALCLLLPTVLSAASLLFSCKESILFSRDINRCLFKRADGFDGYSSVKLYLLRHFVLLIIMLCSAALNAVTLYVFHGKISLFSA